MRGSLKVDACEYNAATHIFSLFAILESVAETYFVVLMISVGHKWLFKQVTISRLLSGARRRKDNHRAK